MPIAEKEVKRLWGMAGGYCSNPECRDRVAIVGDKGQSYLIGEMAHIIARQARGPRGDGVGGDNTYANLVLLCPTCHRKVDKAPAEFPVNLLIKWKDQHESWVNSWAKPDRINSTQDLMSFIFSLLEENHHFFKDYGPDSSIAATNPLSSAYAIWVARRLDTILPNNQKVISALNENKKMVPGEMKEAVLMFRDHASSYEQNAYDRLDHYRLFPMLFAKLVEKYKNE